MFELFPVCLKNLKRKRVRSLLTILSIAIGVGSVVLISAIGGTGRLMLEEELSKLGLDGVTIVTDSKVSERRIDQQDLEIISASNEVESAAPVMLETSRLRMHGLVADTVVWGVDNNARDALVLTLRHGREFDGGELARNSRVCLVDIRTANMFYKRSNIVGKQLSLEFNGVKTSFEVIGVVETGGSVLEDMVGDYVPGFVYLPYTTLQQVAGKQGFSQISVKVSDKASVQETADALVAALERTTGTYGIYKAENLSEQRQRMGNVLESVTMVLTVIAGISLVVAGLGIMTVMIVSVHERTREIGIKKSIGATERTIMTEFLIEAFALSVAGGFCGTAGGWLLAGIGGALAGISIQPSMNSILLCMGFTVTVGVLFGVYPARLAARMHPVDALRMES